MARKFRGIHTKYGNVRTKYKGIGYHSKLEALYARYLDGQKRNKKIVRWRRQIPVDLCVAGVHIANLIVDFLVTHRDRSLEYVEIKGLETDVWKLKYKLLKALYPTVKYTVLKRKQLKELGVKL